jgi:histidinol dehydrogenase
VVQYFRKTYKTVDDEATVKEIFKEVQKGMRLSPIYVAFDGVAVDTIEVSKERLMPLLQLFQMNSKAAIALAKKENKFHTAQKNRTRHRRNDRRRKIAGKRKDLIKVVVYSPDG